MAVPKSNTFAGAALGLLLLLVGCATNAPPYKSVSTLDSQPAEAAQALLAGNADAARRVLATALRATPENGYLHLLNGLSYDLAAPSPQAADLAGVGYESATRLAPGYYWAHYFNAVRALKRQQFSQAATQFAAAIQSDDQRAAAYVGLAVAAYSAGDLEVASRASNRALTLSPDDPAVLRTAAYVAAAEGDRHGLERLRHAAHSLPVATADFDAQSPRFAQLLRNASLNETPPSVVASGDDIPPDTHQLMLEVTLLLSQNAETQRTGINLLDGLTLQFGGRKEYRDEKRSGILDTSQRILTSAISLPDVTYSLNLFNTTEDYYEVIARPSLVASLGQQSDFFIGRTITVGVSGINLGSLQPIDVGTSVKVTPLEIGPRTTKFRVDVARSFFEQSSGGTFTQSLTTFKQSVGATVEVAFGQTLILSGLYEAVNIGGASKTRGAGDVPLLGKLFNTRSITATHDAALVLVTPRLPGSFATGPAQFRTETLQRVLNLWDHFVMPNGGIDATLGILETKTKYFRPLVGDVRAPDARDPVVLAAVLKDTLARLR